MRTRTPLNYLMYHAEFYETIDAYEPDLTSFFHLVRHSLGEEWTINRSGPWFVCVLSRSQHPAQGWKIHLSSSIDAARELLAKVVPLLRDSCVDFKFVLDSRTLARVNGKHWARGSAGKFLTVYPQSQAQFFELIEQLNDATQGFVGPYILSDRRYKDSRVVFYRYGGFLARQVMNVKGERTATILSPQNERIPDKRQGYFVCPAWVTDPFAVATSPATMTTLRGGRYWIHRPLVYSNAGGIYVGLDKETGEKVIIKEARPLVVSGASGEDAVTLLKREYRILERISGTGVSPKPIDFFQEWEHFFLVEEYVDGISLYSFVASSNVAVVADPTEADLERFDQQLRKVFKQLMIAVQKVHERKVVLCDLSPNNVLVVPETLALKIIDFEGAAEIDVDHPVHIFTSGFRPPKTEAIRKVQYEDDYYSLGSMLVSYLLPVNALFGLKPSAALGFLDALISHTGQSDDLQRLVRLLLSDNPAMRPKPQEAIDTLDSMAPPVKRECLAVRGDDGHEPNEELLLETLEYIRSSANTSRSDRLFPADSKVFRTNGLGLAHGASGVVYALRRTQGTVPSEFLQWISERTSNSEQLPPGLYMGTAGIAWALLEMGFDKEAAELLEEAAKDSLVKESPDLFYGVAGWGMTNLHFFACSGNQIYLERAVGAGQFLLDTVVEEREEVYWKNFDKRLYGLAHGASGIALFLLYLYLATNREEFVGIGEKALDSEIQNGIRDKQGGLQWSYGSHTSTIYFPYWRFGSAGVGIAVLRYWKLLAKTKHRTALDNIYLGCNKRFTVFPGFLHGLAGIGDFLLDAYQLTDRAEFLDAAGKIAASIRLFAIKKETGTAFPGDDLHRLSCDLGTGSSGVALFFHRLSRNDGPSFLVDELFSGTPRSLRTAAGDMVKAS